MHYGELKKCDIANGIGVRVTLFVSGCTNRCPDCFQPQTWDFDYGKEFTEDTKAEIFAELDKPFVNGLTVLGGEPFEPRNQRELLPLRSRRSIRARPYGALPGSGWTMSCWQTAAIPGARQRMRCSRASTCWWTDGL